MGVSRETVVVTVDATRGGTATSATVVSGQVVSVRSPSTAWTAGGSADLTITRIEDGGTILAVTDIPAGDFQYQPRNVTHTITGGTTAYANGVGPVLSATGVPVDGEFKVVVLQAAANTAGTVHVYYTT